MMTTITIFGLLFALHFILTAVGSKLKSPKRFLGDNLYISYGESKSLMVSLMVIQNPETSDSDRSHQIIIEGFGITIAATLFRKFTKHHNRIYLFGFHSDNGEYLWKEFWYYNPFSKKNAFLNKPWDTTAVYVHTKYLNIETGEMQDEPVPVKILTDTSYTTKTGEMQAVDNIEFYLVERRWTSPIAKTLRIADHFYKQKVNLMMIKPVGTIGVGETQTNEALLSLTDDIISLFNETVNTLNQIEKKKLIGELIIRFEERIAFFMLLDKNY